MADLKKIVTKSDEKLVSHDQLVKEAIITERERFKSNDYKVDTIQGTVFMEPDEYKNLQKENNEREHDIMEDSEILQKRYLESLQIIRKKDEIIELYKQYVKTLISNVENDCMDSISNVRILRLQFEKDLKDT